MKPPRETEADPSREQGARGSNPRPLEPDALPRGTRLDEFEIIDVLGSGGFGIVYLALDLQLQRQVAIKEFIPAALAGRDASGSVAVRSAEAAETFSIGLESFYNEGRLLARFDHPSLVRVFRFWKARGTAYMAMQYYPGETLKEARAAMRQPPDEAWLRGFVDRLLGALATLHAEGVYHRDIAPDNILLMPDGRPVVLDFGSARRVIGDRTQSLTAILKPNYSPVEQYADDAGMRQGAYTDLYALGGTVYFLITGRDPVPAVMRAVRDSFPLLARVPDAPYSGLSSEFLAVVDWSLGVSPDDRPQTVEEVRAALSGETVPPEPRERSGVLIAEPGQAYDAERAMAKTQRAAPRVDEPPIVRPVTAGRGRKLLFPGLALGACVGLLWAFAGTPHFLSAEAQPAATPQAQVGPVGADLPVPTIAPAGRADAAVEPSTPPPRDLRAEPAAAPIRPIAAPSSALEATARPPAASPPASDAGVRAPTVARSAAARQVSTAAGTSGPDSCLGLGVFARVSCVSRACAAPSSASHPQCREARRIAEQRQQRMDQ